jgi:FkbM family methyltransferase
MKNRLITLLEFWRLAGWRQVLALVAARLDKSAGCSVTIPGLPHPLWVRFNNSDLVLLIGIFHLRDSHLQLTPPPATIIDLGANIGLTAVALHRQFPLAEITALEPDAAAHAVCQLNCRPYARIRCQQRMIAGRSGWCHPRNPEAISMARYYDVVNSAEPGAVEAVTLPALLLQLNAPSPILVKMDIEGSEVELFQQAVEWLPAVAGVLVEPHGEGTAELIRRTFIAHGFATGRIGEKLWGYRLHAWSQPIQFVYPVV